MSKYVDIEPIIENIYKKWGGDPAYYIDVPPEGREARRDAELIETLRGQPEISWIPCAERLPKPHEKVLVATKFGMEVAWAMDESGNLWLTSLIVLGGDEVFAWMPLPEPYRGASDGKAD